MLQARLKVVGGRHDGRYIPLKAGRFLIGREEDCHLRPSSEMISRHHCAITLDGFTVRIRDLGSTNGTFVNGEQIHRAVMLSPGDRIEVGKLHFEILIAEVAVDPAAQPVEPMSDSVLSEETTEMSSGDTSTDGIPVAPILADSNTSLNAGSDTTVMMPIPPEGDSSQVVSPQQPAAAYPPQPAGYPPQPPMMYPQPLYPNYPQPFVYPQMGMPYGQPPVMYPPQGAYPQQPPMMYPPQGAYPQQPPAPAAPSTSGEEIPVNLPPPEATGVREPEQTTDPGGDEKTPAEGDAAKNASGQTDEQTDEQNPSNTAADIIRNHFSRRPPTT